MKRDKKMQLYIDHQYSGIAYKDESGYLSMCVHTRVYGKVNTHGLDVWTTAAAGIR